ncbi:MAG TPA: hypothetical protein VGM80_14660 [Gaiellaceae bacterium]
MTSRRALLPAIVLCALALAAAAGAAAPKPDAHDRALAARLNAKVSTFANIVTQTGENALIKNELKDCAPFKSKDPGKAFAAAFALLPALLVRVVDDYKPQLTDITQTLAALHPDSPLFRKWASAVTQSYTLMLQFDNHGQKVDLCAAVTVFLAKSSTAADIQRVLGVDPKVVAKLFGSASSNTKSKLDPKMRAFFIAAGVPPKNAKTLTS